MINLEDAQVEAEVSQRELAEIEAAWADNQADLRSEQTELISKINELTDTRDQHTLSLTSDSINAYENAIRRAGLTAVVPLKSNRCGGCQVTVPANLVKQADEGGLVICDSCTRVLCPV